LDAKERSELRSLVQRLLPELGLEGLLDHMEAEMPDRPESLGWAWQYAQEEAKDEAYRRLLQRGQKVAASELAAVTQLFTPSYIARCLAENSLGRLWLRMHPDSALARGWACFVPTPSGAPAPSAPVPRLAREIRVLDPACGAMHLGLAAYDLLAQCYEEELARAGEPGWPERPSVASPAGIPAAILRENLHGIDIDPGVLAVARRVLRLRAGAEPENLLLLPGPEGALNRKTGPEGPFHVVIANPPYLARKHGEARLSAFLAREYPEGKGDLYTAFLQRAMAWLAPGGYAAMVTQSSFMFLGSFARLRRWLLERAAVEAVIHLGPGAFAEIGGEKVNAAAYVLRREDDARAREQAAGSYLRLVDGGEEEKRRGLAGGRVFTVPQSAIARPPGAPWVWWVPPELQGPYRRGERLGDRVRFCRGITTGANRRFVRYWWEVGLEAIEFGCRSAEEAALSPKRWFPYMKGGAPVRWFGNVRHVLDWADGGRELRAFPRAAVRNLAFQFRPGVTYSSVTGGSLTARWMDAGYLFDQASNGLFPLDEADGPVLLALLNHPVAGFTAGFNPTVNIVMADLYRIPWPEVDRGEVARRVEECVRLARALDAMDELSPFFRQPPLPDRSDLDSLTARLAEREAEVEALLDEGLGLTPAGRARIREGAPQREPVRWSDEALREAWVSYALGILLGRCRPGGYGGGPLLAERWEAVAPLIPPGGSLRAGEAEEAVRTVLAALLGRPPERVDLARFLRSHARTYKKSPVFVLEEGRIQLRPARPS